jgi:tight adherence protein B
VTAVRFWPGHPRQRGRSRLLRLAGVDTPRRAFGSRLAATVGEHTSIARAVAAVAPAAAAGLAAGPVAAGIAAVYGCIAVGVFVERRRAAAELVAAASAMDGLVALTAELRAGAEPAAAASAVLPTIGAAGGPGARIAERIRVACRVAEVTGARLGDLLDRVDADARTVARVGELASAQAAGVRATAWLLAGLPIAGIVLGYGIGADPLRELLHTKIGASCAALALFLQVAGLAWTQRLAASAKAAR